MSKRNKNTQVPQLSAEQIAAIADCLRGTRQNVYQLCQSMFGIKANDKVFERLESEAGLFKCEECNEWKDNSLKDASMLATCADCVNAMNEE